MPADSRGIKMTSPCAYAAAPYRRNSLEPSRPDDPSRPWRVIELQSATDLPGGYLGPQEVEEVDRARVVICDPQMATEAATNPRLRCSGPSPTEWAVCASRPDDRAGPRSTRARRPMNRVQAPLTIGLRSRLDSNHNYVSIADGRCCPGTAWTGRLEHAASPNQFINPCAIAQLAQSTASL